VAAVIMLHGSLTREPDALPEASPSPTAPAAPNVFRPDLEKTPLTYFADYWQQLGTRVRDGLALAGDPATPAIAVAPGLALTSTRALAGLAPGDRTSSPGGPRLLAADDELGLALFEVDASVQPFDQADAGGLGPGTLVAAVTLGADRRLQVAPGYLVSAPVSGVPGSSADTLDLSIVLPSRNELAAVVDLDGKLVGAALQARSGLRLLSAAALVRMAAQLRANPVCRSIDVATPPQAVRELLAVKAGVVVERVRQASYEREPSLRAGDLLLDWNGAKPHDAEEFGHLYDATPAGSVVALELLRGRRRLTGSIVMPGRDCRPVAAPALMLDKAGLTLRWDAGTGGRAPGWRVLGLTAGGAADAAGVSVGDRILTVDGEDGEAASRRAIESYERRPRPLLLSLRRGDRTLLAALGAGRSR
jgi:S1-C subfamily serine protease